MNNLLSSTVHRACNARLRRLLETRWGGVGSILLMHRVVERKDESAACGLTITTSFRDQALTALRAADVELVDLKELYGRLSRSDATSRRAVALTFDDGYRDNLTLALPILRKHQAPATIFVPSGAPDRTMDAWFLRLDRAVMSGRSISLGDYGLADDMPAETPAEKATTYRRLARFIHRDIRRNRSLAEKLLPQRVVSDEALLEAHFASWSELRTAAADPLLTIGAHTVSHPVLSHLPLSDAQAEVVEGRRRLSARLDREIRLFSYPYGGRTECGNREYRLARQAGFDLAVTTRYGALHGYHDTSPYALPRKTLGGLRESLGELALDVLGSRRAVAQAGGLAASPSGPELRWR